MKKYSKEYAEKMLTLDSKDDMIFRNSYIKGYLKCAEENNVEGLIEALRLSLSELTPIMRHIAEKELKKAKS